MKRKITHGNTKRGSGLVRKMTKGKVEGKVTKEIPRNDSIDQIK
jgi:hypothetical protein